MEKLWDALGRTGIVIIIRHRENIATVGIQLKWFQGADSTSFQEATLLNHNLTTDLHASLHFH